MGKLAADAGGRGVPGGAFGSRSNSISSTDEVMAVDDELADFDGQHGCSDGGHVEDASCILRMNRWLPVLEKGQLERASRESPEQRMPIVERCLLNVEVGRGNRREQGSRCSTGTMTDSGHKAEVASLVPASGGWIANT